MNKDLVLLLVKSFENMPSDISRNKTAIVDSVNKVLLSDFPITDNIKKEGMIGDGPICRLEKPTISSMARFLKDFKDGSDTFESSQNGIKFAVENLNVLRDFAQKTNAEVVVVNEINELLETLSK